MKKTISVNQVSLYREIAKNLVNPLEVIREAISNCHDAQAKEIEIEISRGNDNEMVIRISDDGTGMDEEGFQRFFNLGDSKKKENLIGQKGLGTKTYFRSKKILVDSQTTNQRLRAVMESPWETLNSNQLPEYELTTLEKEPGMDGTKITIEDYQIDIPEKYFNFSTLKDYMLWFTAAGSFKTKFAEQISLQKYVQNMHIAPKIFLKDKIENKTEEFSGAHRFSPPCENPDIPENSDDLRADLYCKHFGPFHRETTIQGNYVSFQLYGTVSGLKCRQSICTLRPYEQLKSRFGLYLCKDFVPVVNRRDLLSDDQYHHYHLLLNSQNFDLTADRNNISNDNSPETKWVLQEFQRLFKSEISMSAEKSYFVMRKEELAKIDMKKRIKEVQDRIENYRSLPDLDVKDLTIVKRPDNEAQVAVLFASLIAKYGESNFLNLKIGHYSGSSSTDLICEKDDGSVCLVEFEYKLSNLFKHGHPYATFAYIICWEVDLEVNETKKTPENVTLKLVKDGSNWLLKYGPTRTIPIIELKSKLEELKKP